jgi:hypothetical protein
VASLETTGEAALRALLSCPQAHLPAYLRDAQQLRHRMHVYHASVML